MCVYVYAHIFCIHVESRGWCRGSTLIFVLLIINNVPSACCGETCPWYAFRGQVDSLLSSFQEFSEWNSDPQTGEAISLTCLAICTPSLFSETMSLTVQCMDLVRLAGQRALKPPCVCLSSAEAVGVCFQRVLGAELRSPCLYGQFHRVLIK